MDNLENVGNGFFVGAWKNDAVGRIEAFLKNELILEKNIVVIA